MTDGEMRRMNILEILNNRTTPVSGTELAGKLGVSTGYCSFKGG